MRSLIPFAALLLSACGGGGGGTSGGSGNGSGQVPSTCPIPNVPATATWSGHVYPMLHSATCGSASISCHGGAASSGRLDYSADAVTLFAALVGKQSTTFNTAGWDIVKARDSSHSWLYEKVHPAAGGQPGLAVNNPVGSQMPLGGSLCTATTDTIKAWIDQGAQNN
jgi:hypothetical protein